MDQYNDSHGDVSGYITPPTPKCSSELEEGVSEPEEGEIAEDSSEWEPLPRLKKWILYEKKLNPWIPIAPYGAEDNKFVEFQDKYASWNREYEDLWKQVQTLKRAGQDGAASALAAANIAVMGRELQEMRKAFGLEEAADLARKIHHKAESSRMSQARWNDWATPWMVDSILRFLPYKAKRVTVVAALREFRGRINYAVDYLMPGKGIANQSDSNPGYDDMLEDPPTPGKGIDFDLLEDDPPTPQGGIDFDLPEDDSHTPRGVSPNEQQWAFARVLGTRIDGLEKEVSSLKTQLIEKRIGLDLAEDGPSTLRHASHAQSNEQTWAEVRDLKTRTDTLEARLGSLETRLRGALKQHR